MIKDPMDRKKSNLANTYFGLVPFVNPVPFAPDPNSLNLDTI